MKEEIYRPDYPAILAACPDQEWADEPTIDGVYLFKRHDDSLGMGIYCGQRLPVWGARTFFGPVDHALRILSGGKEGEE